MIESEKKAKKPGLLKPFLVFEVKAINEGKKGGAEQDLRRKRAQ